METARERVITLGDVPEPPAPETYNANVTCSNCDYAGPAAIEKGKLVNAGRCPACDCVTLTKKTVPQPEAIPATVSPPLDRLTMEQLVEEHRRIQRHHQDRLGIPGMPRPVTPGWPTTLAGGYRFSVSIPEGGPNANGDMLTADALRRVFGFPQAAGADVEHTVEVSSAQR